MRPGKIPALAVLFTLLLVLGARPAPAFGQRVVRDMAGRQVALPIRVERVVALGPGCLRLLVYLQAQGLVKGVEALEPRFPQGRPYFMAHPELGKLPLVGPGGVPSIGGLPDLEALLAVRPQVVFATYLKPAQADFLAERCRCPVVLLDYGPFASFRPATVTRSLELAGKVLGREKRAAEVASFLKRILADLRRRAEGAPAPAPAYVGGIGFRGSHGLESSDAGYQPFAWLGVPNAAKALAPRGHVFVDKERLLALDPATIFVDGGGLRMVRADFARRPRYYRSLKAFRERRVFLLHPFNWYTTNLGTVLADAYAVGRVLLPSRFGDVDPAAKADEIYQYLVGASVHRGMERLYGPLGRVPEFLRAKQRSRP